MIEIPISHVAEILGWLLVIGFTFCLSWWIQWSYREWHTFDGSDKIVFGVIPSVLLAVVWLFTLSAIKVIVWT